MDTGNDTHESTNTDKLSLIISVGFMLLFVIFYFINSEALGNAVNTGFAWSIKYFGAYWQVLLLATFLIGLGIAISRNGSSKLGGLEKPEFITPSWIAIIMCTLLAGGGVFWAAAEPIAHFVSPPPTFAASDNPFQIGINALSQSFMHWGFLAWAILGSLTTIVLSYLHYDKGLPLKPRTLLYPLFKEKIHGPIGSVIDACCLIAVAAGTIGPIGFLGLQVSYILNDLFNVPDAFITQLLVIAVATSVYVTSALTGIYKGIRILSKYNVSLAVLLMLYILIFGRTGFIVDAYLQGVGNLISNFFEMAAFRSDTGWLGWWTVFFWGWFLGYGPVMAIFIARISRGRSIRQMILTISIIAPLVTMFWFTIVGGSGIAHEITSAGAVSKGFEGFNLPGALLAITSTLPLSTLISVLFLILTITFIVTTGDSITYTMSVISSSSTKPPPMMRAVWGVAMGIVAIILISIGSSGISALQSFIVITAVPVSLILLPSLWDAPKIAKKMSEEQEIK